MDSSGSRITRSQLDREFKTPLSSNEFNNNRKRGKKHSNKEYQEMMTEEDFDVSFSALLPSSAIPATIIKPKHQLAHTWTLWYSAANRKLSWRKNQVKIFSIYTIEDFWLMYNQVKPASCLPDGHTYSVFRDDILPDREEVDNRDGGKWMVNCPRNEREEKFDNKWLNVLFMIMENEKYDRLITGAEACVRLSEDRLEVWIGDVSDLSKMIEVGRTTKKKLELDSNNQLEFSIHKDERRGIAGPKLAL